MPWKLWSLVFLAGMPGVVAAAWLGLPELAQGAVVPVPWWVLQWVTGLQLGLLLALAAWGGARLAPRVGLRAPVLSAWAMRQPLWPAWRPQFLPGAAGGVAGATLLLLAAQWAPEALQALPPQAQLPLAVRLLYGGVTEEVLLRWGIMSALAWAAWRVLQRGQGGLHAGSAWLAIGASALLFAAGHLPAAAALVGSLTVPVVAYVLVGNGAFGVVAGWLYWRWGLEAAVLAHGLAHLLAYLGTAVPMV